MWAGTCGSAVVLGVLLAACGGDRVREPPRDAGADVTVPDAGHDARTPPGDAAPDECRVRCLGIECDARFDAAEGTAVRVTNDGALELAAGAGEGELRHVFVQQDCGGLWTLWRSVTVAGALGGVSLDVRGADELDDLAARPWQSVQTGAPLPVLDPSSGCGPRLLEVRVGLRASGLADAPRVDSLGVCYGCTAILC